MGPSLCWKLTVPECLEEPNEVVYPGDLYCALNFTHTHTTSLMVVNSKIAVIP